MTKSLETIREAVRRAPLTNPVGLPTEWQAYFDAVTPLHVADLIAVLAQAQQRIDVLENDEVHQRLANAEHQLHMVELAKYNLKTSRRAQFRKRLAAERKVSELEARTLSFTLPDPSSKAFWGGTGKNETFYPSTYKRWLTEAIESAGIIARIKIEVK